jgi:hypothetical protein
MKSGGGLLPGSRGSPSLKKPYVFDNLRSQQVPKRVSNPAAQVQADSLPECDCV